MKRIQLKETELTNLIHRVIQEQEKPTTHNELMDTIEKWCKTRNKFRYVEDIISTIFTHSGPASGAIGDIITKIQSYCDGLQPPDKSKYEKEEWTGWDNPPL